jgi:hypothetical protein
VFYFPTGLKHSENISKRNNKDTYEDDSVFYDTDQEEFVEKAYQALPRKKKQKANLENVRGFYL